STPSGSRRRPGRRPLPGTQWPSGHRYSGSASRCRLLLDPEGDGSFEQITLHPQPGVLALQLPQPGLLIAGQAVLLATVDAVLAHPIPQGRVVDAQLPGDLGDRPARGAHELHRVAFELGGELTPAPWLSIFHADILRLREVSCLRGEVQPWPAASSAAPARPNMNAISDTRSGAGLSGARIIDSRVDSGRFSQRLTGPSASLPSERPRPVWVT